MQQSRERISMEEANKIFNEILEEDRQEDEDEDSSEECLADCAEEDPVVQEKFCECIRIADNSSRFSLRVMEAMRSLQNDEDDFLPTSSIENIVDYIQKNYRDDGDLYAQVRTALKQVCSQGFAMELLENEYHLIGPDAASMNRITCSNGPKDCSSSPPVKPAKFRKKHKSNDTCICEIPSSEETGPTTSKRRRVSKGGARESQRLKYSNLEKEQNNREDKMTDCTCSLTITDDDINALIYGDGMQENMKNISKMQKNTQHALQNERRSKSAQKPLIGTSRTKRADNQMVGIGDSMKDKTENPEEIDEDDFEINKVEKSQSQIRLKKARQTEEELERWIERCRKECERRKNRRTNNN